MSFTTIDIIFSIIVLVFALGAWLSGLIKELLGKLAPVVSILVAALFFGSLTPTMAGFISYTPLAAVVAFLVLFVVTFIAVKIMQKLLSVIFSGEILGALNKILGLLFGLVEGLAVVSAIIIVLLVQPWFNVEALVRESLYWQLLGALLDAPVTRVRDVFAAAKEDVALVLRTGRC